MYHPCSITTDVIQTDSGAFISISDTARARIATTSANPCSEVTINTKTTTYIGSEYVEIAGKRFDSKQLAYLLSKLLDEHPECKI